MARISIEVTAEQHRYIKMLAAAENSSIKDLVIARILEGKPRKFKPATEKALRDSRNGIGLSKRYASTEEMFQDMGIPLPPNYKR